MCTFKNVLTKGIACLAFSSNGEKLAAAAIDVNHEIAIFDVTVKSKTGGILICKENGGSENIFEIAWKNESVIYFYFNFYL